MKIRLASLLLIVLAVTFSSCQAIADIFKTGVWFGVIGVVVVIALILYFVGKARK